jgi:hypothetical protein
VTDRPFVRPSQLITENAAATPSKTKAPYRLLHRHLAHCMTGRDRVGRLMVRRAALGKRYPQKTAHNAVDKSDLLCRINCFDDWTFFSQLNSA